MRNKIYTLRQKRSLALRRVWPLVDSLMVNPTKGAKAGSKSTAPWCTPKKPLKRLQQRGDHPKNGGFWLAACDFNKSWISSSARARSSSLGWVFLRRFHQGSTPQTSACQLASDHQTWGIHLLVRILAMTSKQKWTNWRSELTKRWICTSKLLYSRWLCEGSPFQDHKAKTGGR